MFFSDIVEAVLKMRVYSHVNVSMTMELTYPFYEDLNNSIAHWHQPYSTITLTEEACGL